MDWQSIELREKQRNMAAVAHREAVRKQQEDQRRIPKPDNISVDPNKLSLQPLGEKSGLPATFGTGLERFSANFAHRPITIHNSSSSSLNRALDKGFSVRLVVMIFF